MGANYDVISVGPTILEGVPGRTQRGQLIVFVTKPSNLEGELRVVDEDATPAKLAPLLDAAAANLEAIKAL